MEIIALAVMAGLRRRGHEVECLVNGWNDGDFSRRLDAIGVVHHPVYLGKLSRSLSPRQLWWTFNALIHLPAGRRACRRALRRFRPHCVLLYNRDWALLAGFALKATPVVFHVNELPEPTRWRVRLYRRVDRIIGAYIAISDFVRQRLIGYGVAAERIRLVYNGVVAETADVSRGRNGKRVTVGIIGQVGTWKGHDDLIEALHILKKDGFEVECAIFGTGEEAYIRSLREKLARYELRELVSFKGFVAEQESIYGAIDICVAPSRFAEPFGLTVAEAGLRSIPVIATRRGGLPEVVRDGETGFLVDAEAPQQLAERIRQLAVDRLLRRRMGDAARRHVLEHFTQERMVAEIESLCRRVVSEN
jgi:glycosyltransferase involved in cell wall biosynthesis